VRRVHDDRVELTMVEPLMLEWRELKPDMIVKGKVSRLEAYGAFVEIGAERPGLVHVSEISHEYVKNPSEVLKEGQEVEAKILDVDRRKKQIRLSIKAVLPEPEVDEVDVKKAESRNPKKAGAGERGGRKGKKQEEYVEETGSNEPELTAFQIAFQKAQLRADDKKSPAKGKKKSSLKDEQEEIFNRTLENRITPG
jgi:small subunit ribosomal protein S1